MESCVVCVGSLWFCSLVRNYLSDETAQAMGIKVRVIFGTDLYELHDQSKVLAIIINFNVVENVSACQMLKEWFPHAEVVTFGNPPPIKLEYADIIQSESIRCHFDPLFTVMSIRPVIQKLQQ
jgi:hypothetical protein